MLKKKTVVIDDVQTKASLTDMTNAKDVLKLSREVENSDLWKIYGRESEAGKMLYKLFGKGPQSVKIDYPKPKTMQKPLPFEEKKQKPNIIPPNKTVIEYPEIKSQSKANNLPKIHAVDLIPKRKNEVEIRKEIEEFYSKPVIPLNKGKDRKQMIAGLQAKFKKQRGALPKGAELPVVDSGVLEEINDEELQQRALNKVSKKMTYAYERPKEEVKVWTKSAEEEELDELYNEVVKEIEDRQKYLEEIAHLDEPKIKARVKQEMVERVAELQKIIKMMNRED